LNIRLPEMLQILTKTVKLMLDLHSLKLFENQITLADHDFSYTSLYSTKPQKNRCVTPAPALSKS
jgi:hypothetical protein